MAGNETAFKDGSAYESVQADIIRAPADYVIDYVKLYPWDKSKEPLDLTNVRVQINIFEDIFNAFLTGDISLVDGWDLPMLYPIIGEEILEICWTRPGTRDANAVAKNIYENLPPAPKPTEVMPTEPWKMQFRVIKMSLRKNLRDKVQYYVLHFVSKEMLKNKKSKAYKAYAGTLYSDIVADVFGEYLKEEKSIECESTKYPVDFCVCGWTPSQAINIMASRSIPAKHSGSNYVFFESLKNFNFISLETLFEADPKETFLYQWKNVWINPLQKNIVDDVVSIDGFDYVESIDLLSNIQAGMYGSKLITYDILTRTKAEYLFDYAEKFGEQTHLDEFKLCSDDCDALGAPDSRICLESVSSDLPEAHTQNRMSQMQQLNNNRIALTIPGNTERKCGDCIFFALPNSVGAPEYFEIPEKYLIKKYMITAIRHRIELGGYSQDIEMIKDSFASKIEYIDPVEIFKEIG